MKIARGGNMPKEKTIYDDITELLNGNSKLDRDTKDRYMLLALKQIGRDIGKIGDLKDRVEKLERYSIMYFVQNHPKIAIVIFIIIAVIINSWFISGFRKFFLQLLGFPADLLP